MLEDDLDRLAKAPIDRSLEGLERDIWRGVAAHTAERSTYSTAFAMHLAILTLGTLGSLAVGRQWATTHELAANRGALAPYTRLAASDLLVGQSR